MSTRKKRHLIAGTIIGGLLLAATTQTGNSFALSDTSSQGAGSSKATSQQTPTTTTTTPSTADTSDSPTTTPSTDPGTNAVASGSTASQTAGDSTGVTSSTTDPSTSTNSTSPQSPSSNDPSNSSSNNTLGNNSTATNDVQSKAQTGDATVKDTSTGGDATTGNATADATLVNSIASSSDVNSGNLQTFGYNINGTHNGDIVINPNDILTAMNADPTASQSTGTTTAQNNATIGNLVNLLAKTGNAKVSDNGIGGNATSGNALTEADIVNMIQDLVSSKGAFLGVININGDLNGNIDLPASVVNALLAPTQTGDTVSGDTTATNNTNVNNNITLTALTGNAAVTNNGVAGTATSGNAKTILNELNLINSNIVGGNLLLVFVNVMGNWYGALLSEPAGATTASLGGGITQDTLLPTSRTSATNNSTISNDVTLTSISGNATVANNGVGGGDATTGSATAIADVANILGSQINLSGWLGILIINVFGTWNGSVVIQPTTTATQSNESSNLPGSHHSYVMASAQRTLPGGDNAYFIIDPPQSFDAGQFDLASANVTNSSAQRPGGDIGSSVRQAAVVTNHDTQPTKHLIADFILAGIGLALALTGGISRFFASRRNSD